MNVILYSIPIFLILLGAEIAIDIRGKRSLYSVFDTLSNLSCGILQEVGALVTAGLFAFPYVFVYDRLRIFEMPASFSTWLFAWLGADCAYYWFHRTSHRVAFLWAAHAVHHQSEEYNLSVALRQSLLQPMISWIFYLPLAAAGIRPEIFLTTVALNTVYQFWIHTKLVGSLGPLEWIFNTPSHHRVHHGADAEYLDKNYAGSLIIWDRIFGSFVPEGAPPRYGTVQPLRSWNPFCANWIVWEQILRNMKACRRWHRLYTIIAPPEFRTPGLPQLVPVCRGLAGWRLPKRSRHSGVGAGVNIQVPCRPSLESLFFTKFQTTSTRAELRRAVGLFLVGLVLFFATRLFYDQWHSVIRVTSIVTLCALLFASTFASQRSSVL